MEIGLCPFVQFLHFVDFLIDTNVNVYDKWMKWLGEKLGQDM